MESFRPVILLTQPAGLKILSFVDIWRCLQLIDNWLLLICTAYIYGAMAWCSELSRLFLSAVNICLSYLWLPRYPRLLHSATFLRLPAACVRTCTGWATKLDYLLKFITSAYTISEW